MGAIDRDSRLSTLRSYYGFEVFGGRSYNLSLISTRKDNAIAFKNTYLSIVAVMLAAVLFFCSGGLLLAATDGAEGTLHIRSVVINSRTIFSPQQVSQRQVYKLANRLHSTTREVVIAREIGVRPGDQLSPDRLPEIERHLRQTGLFASVKVEVVAVDDGHELHIDTRDQLTLISSASGSFLGGVGQVGVSIGERNLFGSGNSLTLSYAGTSTGANQAQLDYRDLHFFDPNLSATYRLGRTDEGDYYGFSLARPYKTESQRHSWSFGGSEQLDEADYYERGDSVFQVPRSVSQLRMGRGWRLSSANGRGRWRHRFNLHLSDNRFMSAIGRDADSIVVPLDNRQIGLSYTFGRDSGQRYRKTSAVDTLNFVQDIRLGLSTDLTLGLTWLEEQAEQKSETVLEPGVTLALRFAELYGEHSWLSVRATLSATDTNRVLDDGRDAWSASFATRLFNTRIQDHTLSLGLDYAAGHNPGQLPVQFTLGESNGLRGYPNRQFVGQRRLRLNLEDRLATSLQLGPVDFGLVVFADAGWIGDRNEPLEHVGSSAGIGLRIGSNSLLGANVMRLDIAAPLNPINGDSEPRSPAISLALGQVFRVLR